MKNNILKTKPAIVKRADHANCFRRFCLYVSNHKHFDSFILGCIILNTINFTIKEPYLDPTVDLVTTTLNYIFTAIFTFEAVLKINAQRRNYFHDNWNVLDFIIVIGSLIGIVVDLILSVSIGSQTTLVRTLRVLRILRIIKRAKVLKLVVDTLFNTLPSLANIGGLLLLIVYMYSILGVYLFGNIKLQGNFNHQANF